MVSPCPSQSPEPLAYRTGTVSLHLVSVSQRPPRAEQENPTWAEVWLGLSKKPGRGCGKQKRGWGGVIQGSMPTSSQWSGHHHLNLAPGQSQHSGWWDAMRDPASTTSILARYVKSKHSQAFASNFQVPKITQSGKGHVLTIPRRPSDKSKRQHILQDNGPCFFSKSIMYLWKNLHPE